ncbi:MAG: TRAP transporter small permease subunit, partial [Rhodospirillaceae bacterium]|nr:TRAP transporter small permease subunit [Rhodospirillaceae bacterium]
MGSEFGEKRPFQRSLLVSLKYAKLVSDGMYFFGKWLVILLMLNIATLVLVQVFCRYVIEYSLLWAEDITKWSLVWAGYFGAACAL